MSASAFSVLVPILEDILQWDSRQIRELFATHGLAMQDWDKIRTDWLTFHDAAARVAAPVDSVLPS
jgi:hypothetical protein